MPNGELAAALAHLETTLSEFRGAYEAWLASGDARSEQELRRLLEVAERRLDEARQALARIRGSR